MQDLSPLVLLLTYVIPFAVCSLFSLHTYWAWHAAAKQGLPLTGFAAWHPVAILELGTRPKRPRAPRTGDVVLFVLGSLLPLVNAILLLNACLLAATDSMFAGMERE